MNLASTHMENHLVWCKNYKFYNCDLVIFADEVSFLDVWKKKQRKWDKKETYTKLILEQQFKEVGKQK